MVTIGTLGSHSALNILAGAKDEGFQTLLLCEKKRTFYERFSVAIKTYQEGERRGSKRVL